MEYMCVLGIIFAFSFELCALNFDVVQRTMKFVLFSVKIWIYSASVRLCHILRTLKTKFWGGKDTKRI